jgi:hypothetical protein
VNLGSAKTDLFYERKKYGFKKRWTMWIFSGYFSLILCCGIRTSLFFCCGNGTVCVLWFGTDARMHPWSDL